MVLGIYGPGSFAREIASFARRQGRTVFVSDSADEIGRVVSGLPVLATGDLLKEDDASAVISVADTAARRRIAAELSAQGVKAGTAVAESHERGDNVTVGEGAVVCGFTIFTCDAVIGAHFHCNIYSYVAHDCVIGDFVTLAPRVCINGNTIVEDDVYIGTGAVLKHGTPEKPLRIGRGAVVGMGAVVTKDVPAGAVVIGNPARVLTPQG